MGRNVVTSSQLSLPGLVIGISFVLFHLVWKTPLLRHPIYIAVMYLRNISKALFYISPVIPSSLGAFLFPKLPIAFLISAVVNFLSSAVLMGSCDCSLALR